jgi:hypothetical protein
MAKMAAWPLASRPPNGPRAMDRQHSLSGFFMLHGSGLVLDIRQYMYNTCGEICLVVYIYICHMCSGSWKGLTQGLLEPEPATTTAITYGVHTWTTGHRLYYRPMPIQEGHTPHTTHDPHPHPLPLRAAATAAAGCGCTYAMRTRTDLLRTRALASHVTHVRPARPSQPPSPLTPTHHVTRDTWDCET